MLRFQCVSQDRNRFARHVRVLVRQAAAREGSRETIMSSEKVSIADYTALITHDTEERRFLRTTPWVLDAVPQRSEPLTTTLRYE